MKEESKVIEYDDLKKKFTESLEIILSLLPFEGDLDHYMYECNDAQNGELLKPFDNAKEFLKEYKCKKCKGSGIVRVGYQGWDKNPCPTCNGSGYILKE